LAALLPWQLARAEPAAEPSDPVRIRAVGDVAIAWGQAAAIEREGFDPFRELGGALADADVTFANLEMLISAAPVPKGFVYQPQGPLIRGPLAAAKLVAQAGVDLVALANNHVFDLGQPGLTDTLRAARDVGLVPIGAGLTAEQARAPHITTTRGVRVGWLAFGYGTNHPSGSGAQIAPLEPDEVVAAVRALRPSVDVVLLSLHWGAEYAEIPMRSEIDLAHAAVDAGADAIIGHHPHVLQSVEAYRGRPIAYSIGNFVFGPLSGPCSLSAILELEVGREGPPVVRATLIPTLLAGAKGSPVLARDREGALVRQRIRSTSRRFGTVLVDRGEALEILLERL
jgi:poly-gamma-glutamate synthesis protein (capsule biosynthesis protein)